MSSAYADSKLAGGALWGAQLTRPTTSFSRGCKLWSRERQFYEEERRKNMVQFRGRPYLFRQYPEIGRHYPGTWRVVGPTQLQEIVARLTQPTVASVSRADDIRERTAYVRSVVDTEKAKDIMYRRPTQSADPRLEGHDRTSTEAGFSRGQRTPRTYVRDNRRVASWTHTQRGGTTSGLPAL